MPEEIIELEQVEVHNDLAYFNEVEAGLTILETKYAVVPDSTTPEGKEAIRKGLAEMRPLRTSVDKRRLKLGKQLRQELKDLNATGNRIIDRIRVVENPFKLAKVEGEKAEAEAETKRISGIKTRLQAISDIFIDTEGQTAAEVLQTLTLLTEGALPADFDEFQTEAETLKADVLVRLRKRLGIVKQAEAEAEIQKLEAVRLKEESEKLETDKAKVTKAKTKADDAEKAAEARITAKEAAAEARIKKMEDDAQARIDIMNDKLEATTEKIQEAKPKEAQAVEDLATLDKSLAKDLIGSAVKTVNNDLGPLPRLLSQEEIEESLKQSAQQMQSPQAPQPAYQMPSFGNSEEEPEVGTPEALATVEPATEEQNKVTMLALRGETGMGMRMARTVLDAIKINKIPHLAWVQ